MQPPTHIIHERKLHFIAYKSASSFSVRSVYKRSFEHLNNEGVRATMDSKLEEEKSVIKFLLFEGVKPCHILQRLQSFFLFVLFSKVCLSILTVYSWVLQFRDGRKRERHA